MPVSAAQRIQAGNSPFTQPLSLPAPVKGWNTRDELDAMDPLDAVTLDNFYPDTQGVLVRNGFASHATGLGAGAVETLAEFRSGTSDKLIAACSGSLFDATSSGAVGAPLASGYANDRWQWVNFLSKLILCNGADTVQIYDGASVTNASFTGVTLSTLIGVYQYQQRLFFWQANATGFWYAQLNSISGALAFYDLAPFSPRGGSLIGVTTITHDGGNGVLDFIAFLMSSGDMFLFFGNDPSQASAWQEIGHYRVSPPVNIRAIAEYGAESFVTTFDDYLPMQQQLVALKLGQLPPRSKVSGAVQAAIAANSSAFGWQGLYYPKGRRLIFNVPNPDGTFDQHVCNTALPSQPWCRFQGMDAHCWGILGNDLYFGASAGVVYQADIGAEDAGNTISATAQQAWNKGSSAFRKRMTAVRPVVQSSQGSYSFGVGFDYSSIGVSAPPDLDGPSWTDDNGTDVTDDNGVVVTTGIQNGISSAWFASAGTGTAFGFELAVKSNASTSWFRTDYRLEGGTAL